MTITDLIAWHTAALESAGADAAVIHQDALETLRWCVELPAYGGGGPHSRAAAFESLLDGANVMAEKLKAEGDADFKEWNDGLERDDPAFALFDGPDDAYETLTKFWRAFGGNVAEQMGDYDGRAPAPPKADAARLWVPFKWRDPKEIPTRGSSRFVRENFDTIAAKPLPPRLFDFDEDGKWVNIHWGGYSYEIEMSRIKTPKQLLGWVYHLGQKSWTDTTPERMSAFIQAICRRRGWEIHGL
jgi:hypothetical protein